MKHALIILTPVLAAGLLSSCGKATPATEASAAEKTAPATAQRSELEITLTPSLRDRVKVGEPKWADVGTSLEVAARLEVDERHVARVGSPVMGRITAVLAFRGEEVRHGQLLAELNSTALSDAQLSFLKALSQKLVAQRAVERAQLLVNADVIGRAELQRREAELSQTASELDAARTELAILGMPADTIAELEKTRNIRSLAQIVSTETGTVLDRHVSVGQVIQPADAVFEIADLSNLWLVADVPEENAGNVRVGQGVEAELAAFPGRKVYGKLSFVAALVNPETRTVRVRMDLANPNKRYKPSMLATMVLKNQTERKQVVPASAVVRENDAEHVFVQLDDDTFLLRPVGLGEEQGPNRVLLEGVKAGEKIVVEGAFHLNNERRRQLVRGTEGA